MRAMTLKGKIEDYLNGLDDRDLSDARDQLAKFYSHVTGMCCLTPKRNDRNGCDNCGDTWRPR